MNMRLFFVPLLLFALARSLLLVAVVWYTFETFR